METRLTNEDISFSEKAVLQFFIESGLYMRTVGFIKYSFLHK